MRVAAIDMGTNSFLCLIAEKHKNGFSVLSDQVEIVRLGQGLSQSPTKSLHPEALVRAKNCLTKFKSTIDTYNVDQIMAVATSAARDASNQQELLQIMQDLNLPIRIISGEEEARLTFLGAMMDQDENESMVIDIGGGSTEFLYLSHQQLKEKSLNLGGVRLTEMFFTGEVPTDTELNSLNDHIYNELKSVTLTAKNWVAVAGTPTTLASMHLGLKAFDEKKIHNLRLELSQIKKLYSQFFVPLKERQQIIGLDPKRADIIIAATTILIQAMEYFRVSHITVSTKGIRFGLAKELFK